MLGPSSLDDVDRNCLAEPDRADDSHDKLRRLATRCSDATDRKRVS